MPGAVQRPVTSQVGNLSQPFLPVPFGEDWSEGSFVKNNMSG